LRFWANFFWMLILGIIVLSIGVLAVLFTHNLDDIIFIYLYFLLLLFDVVARVSIMLTLFLS